MADWKNPPRLFIPGPIQVKADVLQQLARPTLGHRDKEYAVLHGEVADMLKKLLFTKQYIFLSTSSGSGLWEASIRNCVAPDETVLATCCGAFSDKWAEVVKDCGRNVDEPKACRTKLAAKTNADNILRNWDMGWHRVTVYGDWRKQCMDLARLYGFAVSEEDKAG